MQEKWGLKTGVVWTETVLFDISTNDVVFHLNM